MTRLTYERAEILISGTAVDICELKVRGDFYEGTSPFGMALGPVSATASVKLTRRSWKRFARAMRRPQPLWWTRARLPISGRRWRWRSR